MPNKLLTITFIVVNLVSDKGSVIYRYDPSTRTFLKHKETGILAFDVVILEYQDKRFVDIVFAVYPKNVVVVSFYPETGLVLPHVSFTGGGIFFLS